MVVTALWPSAMSYLFMICGQDLLLCQVRDIEGQIPQHLQHHLGCSGQIILQSQTWKFKNLKINVVKQGPAAGMLCY